MARISSTAVRQGLAKRAQPKQTAQKTGGGTDYASRFQNPGAGSNRARTVDRSRFLNPGAGTRPTPRAAPRPQAATRRVDPAQTTTHGGFRGATATAGAPPQTPGRPGSRFGAWTPRTATMAPRPAAAPMQPMPARQPMQVAQAAPQPVPGQYQPPGRPMAPQMAQPVYQQPRLPVAGPLPSTGPAAPTQLPPGYGDQGYMAYLNSFNTGGAMTAAVQPMGYQQWQQQNMQPQPMAPQMAQPVYPQPQWQRQQMQPQYNPTPYNTWR